MAKRSTYKTFANDYAAYTNTMDDSNKYNSYTAEFQSAPATNLGILDDKNQITGQTNGAMYTDALNRAYMQHADLSANRSVLSRTLNALMVFNHAGAGFAKGMVDGNGKGSITPLQGLWQGLKASNPFGDGFHQGEYNYSQVLGAAGWNPTSLGGRALKGTLGFVGDVLLDPTTYISGGSAALIKGSGKLAVEGVARGAAEQVAAKAGIKLGDMSRLASDVFDATHERLVKQGVNPDLAGRMALKKMQDTEQIMSDVMKPMMTDRAREIIIKNNLLSGTVISEEQLAKDATNLTNQFNKIIGHQAESTGMTFSLGNLPFAKRIFGEVLAGKSATLASDAALKSFGDATFAKLYSASRNAFYGSKMGELFSTSTPLFRLSQNNPAGLYDLIKFVDHTKGQNLNKAQEETLIRERAKGFNLTPAENRTILDLLQNPSIWTKVKQVFHVADTEEYAALHNELSAKHANTVSQLDELKSMRDQVHSTLATKEGDVTAATNAHDALHREYVRKLINFDSTFTGDKAKVMEHQNMIKEQLAHAELQHAAAHAVITPESIVAKHDAYTAAQKDLQSGVSAHGGENIHRSLIDDLNKHIFGGGDTIAYSTMKPIIDKVVGMLKNGDAKYEIQHYIESKPLMFGKSSTEIYPFVGEVMGYGAGHKYASWKEMFHDRVAGFEKKIADKTITATEKDAMYGLLQLENKRNLLLNELKHKDVGGVLAYIKQYKDAHFMNDVHATNDAALQTARDSFTQDSTARAGYGTDKQDNTIFTNLTVADRAKATLDVAQLLSKKMLKSDEFNKLGWSTFGGKKRLPSAQERVLSAIVDELPAILQSKFGKEIQNLTDKQLTYAYNLAIDGAMKKHNFYGLGTQAAQDTVAKVAESGKTIIQDSTQIGSKILFPHAGKVVGGHVQSIVTTSDGKQFVVKLKSGELIDGVLPKEILNSVPPKAVVLQDITMQRASLLADLAKHDEQLKSMDSAYQADRSSLIHDYKQQLLQTDTVAKDLNQQVDILKESLYTGDLSKIDDLEAQVLHMDNALNTHDAFDSYMRVTLGDERVSNILAAHEKNVAQIVLDADMSISDKVKDIVKVLRGQFIEMADKEVGIGKLTRGQADELLMEYVPHILTPDGKALFEKEITNKKSSITQDIGYGLKFNPHSKSRSIRELEINGEIVKNPTISQINEFFMEKMGGKNAFQESIADIYLTRAMKNTELMYDNEYMHNMMNVFGREVKQGVPIKEGYKAVVNVGKIRESIHARASMLTTAEMSQASKMRLAQGFAFEKMTSEQIQELYKKNVAKSIEQHGMTSELIDSLATPMIELNKEQISMLHGIGNKDMRQVNDAIVLKANQARKIQIAKDQSSFLKLYDKFTHLLKLNMTTITPAFHARNKLANMYLNWLAIGKEAFNVKTQVQMTQLIRNRGKVADGTMFSMHHVDGTVSSMTWEELYHHASAYGVIDEGFFAKDIGASAATSGVLKRHIPAKFNPTDSENFLPYRVGGKIGNVIENTDRLTHFATLLKKGVPMEEAAASVKKYLFDYSDLTGFEQTVMKRIFPFYTWMRKNSALQVSTLIDNPGKFQYVAKSLSGISGMSNTDEQLNPAYVNNYAKDMILTPFRKNLGAGKKLDKNGNPIANTQPILWNPNLPFSDLSRIPNPFDAVNSLKSMFTQLNPIMKVPIEQVANKNVFLDKPIVDTAKGDNQITARADHILSTNAGYNVLKSLSGKGTEDTLLNLLSAGTGVKLSAYDYQASKSKIISEAVAKAKIDIANHLASNIQSLAATPTQAQSPLYTPPSTQDVNKFITQTNILSSFMGMKFNWAMVQVPLPAAQQQKYINAKVTRVIDGDTIKVKIGDKEEEVRFLLIDTPETVKPNTPIMPYGHEASNFTKDRLSNKDIQLYFDTQSKDKYGRILAYVQSDGEDINNTLITKGLAKVSYVTNDNNSRLNKYKESEKLAQLNSLGIWHIPGYADTRDDRSYHLNAVNPDLMKQLNPKVGD